MPVDLDFRIGIVDERRAFAEAVAAANPRQAKRILGTRSVDKAVLTAPVVLAGGERKVGRPKAAPKPKPAKPPRFRKSKYPWRTMGVNQTFDADARITRRCVVKQAGVYRRETGRTYDVKLLVEGGKSVIRVTRLT